MPPTTPWAFLRSPLGFVLTWPTRSSTLRGSCSIRAWKWCRSSTKFAPTGHFAPWLSSITEGAYHTTQTVRISVRCAFWTAADWKTTKRTATGCSFNVCAAPTCCSALPRAWLPGWASTTPWLPGYSTDPVAMAPSSVWPQDGALIHRKSAVMTSVFTTRANQPTPTASRSSGAFPKIRWTPRTAHRHCLLSFSGCLQSCKTQVNSVPIESVSALSSVLFYALNVDKSLPFCRWNRQHYLPLPVSAG